MKSNTLIDFFRKLLASWLQKKPVLFETNHVSWHLHLSHFADYCVDFAGLSGRRDEHHWAIEDDVGAAKHANNPTSKSILGEEISCVFMGPPSF